MHYHRTYREGGNGAQNDYWQILFNEKVQDISCAGAVYLADGYLLAAFLTQQGYNAVQSAY